MENRLTSVLSPVSDLVFHLTNQSLENTPRRRLSLDTTSSSNDTPSNTPPYVTNSGDSKLESFSLVVENESSEFTFNNVAAKNCSSHIVERFLAKKSALTTTPDTPYGGFRINRCQIVLDEESPCILLENVKENASVAQGGPAINVSTTLECDEMTSPILISPAPSSVFFDEDSQDSAYSTSSCGSRKTSLAFEDTFLAPYAPSVCRMRQKSSMAKSSSFEEDDGFMDEYTEIHRNENSENVCPSNELNNLFRGTLLTSASPCYQSKSSYQHPDETPVKRKSGLSAVVLANSGAITLGIKRPNAYDTSNLNITNDLSPTGCTGPPDLKRRKSVADFKSSKFTKLKVPPTVAHLQRCRSDSEVVHALQRCDENSSLIGDFSNDHVLPLLRNLRDPDLKCINGETVRDVIDKRYTDVGHVTIIDCRYPYEFEAGHIRGAFNKFNEELVEEFFLSEIALTRQRLLDEKFLLSNKRNILLFYCEYSKERGPKLFRYLRDQDRTRNYLSYPFLNYPEIYLLEGGYKEFFKNFANYCEPREYKPMNHRDHVNDLKEFRKSKSWSSSVVNDNSCLAPILQKSSGVIRRPGLNKPINKSLFS